MVADRGSATREPVLRGTRAVAASLPDPCFILGRDGQVRCAATPPTQLNTFTLKKLYFLNNNSSVFEAQNNLSIKLEYAKFD